MVVLVPFLLITAVFSRLTIVELSLPSSNAGPAPADPGFRLEVILRDAGIEIGNGKEIIASIPAEDGDYDFATLSDYMVDLKTQRPDHEAASVLVEAQVPYDYVIQVMDTVRTVAVPLDAEAPESDFELMPLFSDISVGDAP